MDLSRQCPGFPFLVCVPLLLLLPPPTSFLSVFPTAKKLPPGLCKSHVGGTPCLWCRCAGDLLRVVATATRLSNLLNIKKKKQIDKSHPPPSAPIHEPQRRPSSPSIPHNPPVIAQATGTRNWRAPWHESCPRLKFVSLAKHLTVLAQTHITFLCLRCFLPLSGS